MTTNEQQTTLQSQAARTSRRTMLKAGVGLAAASAVYASPAVETIFHGLPNAYASGGCTGNALTSPFAGPNPPFPTFAQTGSNAGDSLFFPFGYTYSGASNPGFTYTQSTAVTVAASSVQVYQNVASPVVTTTSGSILIAPVIYDSVTHTTSLGAFGASVALSPYPDGSGHQIVGFVIQFQRTGNSGSFKFTLNASYGTPVVCQTVDPHVVLTGTPGIFWL